MVSRTSLVRLLMVIILLGGEASYAAADDASCTALSTLTFAHQRITDATVLTRALDGSKLPRFCRVRGMATPTARSHIKFEVWLPMAEQWNGRYYQHGEGAGGGKINYVALAQFVKSGSVGAATDDGNQFPWTQAIEDLFHVYARAAHARAMPENVIDTWYRGSHETTTAAKQLIRKYYGHPPAFSYFEGCSGGGNYALQTAQRFPEDWDGLLVGAPANNATGYYAANAWNARLWADAQTRLPPAKLGFIQRAALKACTLEAHVVDEIPSDPRFCRLDPNVLSCKGVDTHNCLTEPERATLDKLYSGPSNPRTGAPIYPGFPATMETYWAGWVTGKEGGHGVFYDVPYSLLSANMHYRYVFGNPQWTPQDFNFDADLALADQKRVGDESLRSVINANESDLRALQRKKAKIVMYFGWADPALTPLEGIAYYNRVRQFSGRRTRDFFRLFMIPGMLHCAGGPGANSFGQGPLASGPPLANDAAHDIARALETWVERHRGPDRIIAVKYVNDDPNKGVAFTRPLCPYPKRAVYRNSGRTAEAANFDCKTH